MAPSEQEPWPAANVSTDRDGRRAIVYVYSDVNPGDFHLFDTETMNAQYLQASAQWIDPALMRPKEPIALRARDGPGLRGYLTRPRDAAGPYPLIVLPHGGPHGIRDRWGYDPEVQLLANRGYAVLQVNFRGSSGYGADFEHAGYGEWGVAMQDDITDATLWAIEEGTRLPRNPPARRCRRQGRRCCRKSAHGPVTGGSDHRDCAALQPTVPTVAVTRTVPP